MSEQHQSWGEPYALPGRRIVFTTWYYVNSGGFQWVDDEGKGVSVIGRQGADEAHFKPVMSPYGVRLAVRPALRQGPLLNLTQPWNLEGALGSVLHENGVYRAWCNAGWGDLAIFAEGERDTPYIFYMESRDGYNWDQPDCNVFEFQGSTKNNIVLKTAGFMGGGLSVFIDPQGPAAERYKLTAEWGYHTPEEIAVYERAMARRPHHYTPRAHRRDINAYGSTRGAVSPDGIRWTMIDEPLVMAHCDTQNIGTWDPILKKYVIYTREYYVRPQAPGAKDEKGLRWIGSSRRSVGRTESDDFREFPLPQVVLEPAPDMKPSDLLYTHCYTTVPGAPDHHLMFPAVWDVSNDATHLRLAASADGRVWHYIGNQPVLRTGDFGQWDGGCIFAHPNMIELPGGDWALPYTGFNVPHKYPRVKATRNSGYAIWPRGRMMALECPEEGWFSTVAIVPPGDRLKINAVTERAGFVQVEAVGVDGKVLPGRSFEDSVPMFGDLFWAGVRWKEHDSLGIGKSDEVTLRFKLRQASIYGLEFE